MKHFSGYVKLRLLDGQTQSWLGMYACEFIVFSQSLSQAQVSTNQSDEKHLTMSRGGATSLIL
jgi:hypothetical protein